MGGTGGTMGEGPSFFHSSSPYHLTQSPLYL